MPITTRSPPFSNKEPKAKNLRKNKNKLNYSPECVTVAVLKTKWAETSLIIQLRVRLIPLRILKVLTKVTETKVEYRLEASKI